MRALEEGDGRRASYLELFFDLVFVVAIGYEGIRSAIRASETAAPTTSEEARCRP